MSKTLRIATVFSGIGAFEQALLKLDKPFEIVFACDNGERELNMSYEEIVNHCKKNKLNDDQITMYIKDLYKQLRKPNYMKTSYFENYKITEDKWYEDIRFINGTTYKNKIDILVGGSPCQSFSIIGKKAGLDDARGTLFYDYARLIKQIEPKVFIYENVTGMINHDKGNTWKVIKEIFNSLGYKIYYKVLNAKDYGIPQDRKRIFVVGFKNPINNFNFPHPILLEKTMFDFLEAKINPNHYLGKKGFEFVTNPTYKSRARINREIIQTQKANQQFNWNGDFVFEDFVNVKDNDAIMNRAYVGLYNGKRGVIRQLTHRECLRLMGFNDDYKIVVPNTWAYRQAGNSIVVDVLKKILEEILKVENLYEKN